VAIKKNSRTVAAALTAGDIRWLDGLDPERHPASGSAVAARLDGFFQIADAVPAAVAAAVSGQVESETEAAQVCKVVDGRLGLLTRELSWAFSSLQKADTGTA